MYFFQETTPDAQVQEVADKAGQAVKIALDGLQQADS
jgi:hypothetical protein